MIRTSRRGFLAGTVSVAALPTMAQAQVRDALAAGFMTPPDSAKPRVWWHWMNGNVTKDGIAKDLAWMKRVGIGGVQNFDAALNTPQVVANRLVYMSPEWKDAFKFAVERAESLDLEFAVASSAGWSETGGPWVEAKDGMKKIVWSETVVEGGSRFNEVLTAPPTASGVFHDIVFDVQSGAMTRREAAPVPTYYADVLVLAVPLRDTEESLRPRSATANGAEIDASVLFDGQLTTGVNTPEPRNGQPGVLQYDLGRARTARSATIFVSNLPTFSVLGARTTSLEASADGRSWRKLAELKLNTAPTTVSFEPTTARYFRLAVSPGAPPSTSFFNMAPGVDLSALLGSFGDGATTPPPQQVAQFELFSYPRVNAFETKGGYSVSEDYFALDANVGADVEGVAASAVLDITEHMGADGRLDWTPPAGRWKVLRLGYSLTGKVNHPATAEATGLEVDKYDAEAVGRYLNYYLDMYQDAVGGRRNIGARGVRALLTDSTEVGASNWTPRMLEHFQRLRGYDAKPWLPTLTGVIVGSRAQSDAFLYDFRRTLSELHASEHYGTVARIAHERGMIVYGESLEGTRATLGDDLDMRSYADIPMSALWTYGAGAQPAQIADGRGAASVAHLRGSTLVACESLTSIGQPHNFAPRDLQPMIDLIFANGVNRPVIHTSVHQPLDDGPGFSLQVFGQYFTRLESWAEMAKPWVDYISRNCYLLQQGRNVADVLYFYGEDAPIGVQANQRYLSDTPKRYAYDFVSGSALANLSANNGDIVSSGGARYKALYLSAKTTHMTLPTLRKLLALAEAGATIIGEAPQSSPALNDDRAEFTQITHRMWSGGAVTQVGQGRVIAGRDVEAAFAQAAVSPDFAYEHQAELLFVHRSFEGGDLYFVTNRSGDAVQTEARFRVSGKVAELWHADTGAAELASYRTEGAQTIVPLDLRAHESVFVVFRTPSTQGSATVVKPSYRQVAALDGAWDVGFQTGRGAPAGTTLPALASLSEQSDPGIKYFSGVSTYTKTFDLPAGARRNDPLLLDLGAIGDIAEVRVNGRLAGTVWRAPYRIDIGAYVRSGRNTLDIRVANLWVNRLIGDQQPGMEKVAFSTVPTFVRSAPLRPSGLIGPVTLWVQSS